MSLRPKSLSPTNIDTYLQCLLKFWFRYHTKEVDLGDTTAMRFGSAVHSALEALNKRLLAGDPLSAELCEEIAGIFPRYAAAQKIGDMNLIKEGQDIVRARLQKHNPTYKVVATELNFYKHKVTTNKGVPLTGIIDLVQEMSPTSAIILDYKTSRRAKTLAEAKTDIQLSMYDYMFSKLNPQYQKIWLALEFLRSESVVSDRTPDERAVFEDWLNNLWMVMGDQSSKDVKAEINIYCPWCGFKHKCTAYEAVLKSDTVLSPMSTLGVETEFVSEWKRVKALEKIAKERILELKKWAEVRVDYDGIFQFGDDDTVISVSQPSKTFYDLSVMLPYIPVEDIPRIVSVRNELLETYVATERPDLKVLLGSAARRTPMAPRMTQKKR